MKIFCEKHCTQAVSDKPYVITEIGDNFLKPNYPFVILGVSAIWHGGDQDVGPWKGCDNRVLPALVGP